MNDTFANVTTIELDKEDFQTDEDSPQRPPYHSPEWQEYVMSFLTESEQEEVNGKKVPKVSGLRRIVEKIIGPIVYSGPKQVITSNGTFTVLFEAQVRWDLDETFDGIRIYSDIADANLSNTPGVYGKHLSPTASSRAESRVYRRILLLNVCTAEELKGDGDVSETDSPPDKIIGSQKMVIEKICENNNIDIDKLLSVEGLNKPLSEISYEEARKLTQKLNEQRKQETPDFLKKDN